MAEKPTHTFSKTELPSVLFYDMLIKDSMGLAEVRFCNTFSNKYSKNKQIKDLFIKYINYLNKQNDMRKEQKYKNIDCKIFTYWLYEKLLKTLGYNKSLCNSAFDEIQSYWISLSEVKPQIKEYKCQPYSYIKNYYDNWKDSKELYDYYIDFNYLDKLSSNCNENCDELCKYLKDVTVSYDKFKMFFSSNKGSRCPLSLHEYKKCDPKLLLERFKCYTPTNELDNGETKEPELEGEVTPERGELSDAASFTVIPQNESELKNDESSPLRTFGNSLLGLVLTSMLFGVLYNFTPLGRIFQNKFPNVAYMINNLSHKGKRLSNHRSDTYSPFREYLEENYIRYDPV
ncbi:variable surface protein [Plasmodium gonderi]|uniref:Variable surface protein n=1 Tax=Plasmodium gonderi TaxID=77519 RepID=A0A1Y1JTF5_PLAGO|nr:variable surface protein [Plasmodium gonderi]GAW84725.1 variable surface protein [Plasmodium gonderi]